MLTFLRLVFRKLADEIKIASEFLQVTGEQELLIVLFILVNRWQYTYQLK